VAERPEHRARPLRTGDAIIWRAVDDTAPLLKDGGHEIAHSTGGHDERTESARLLLKRLTAALHTCRLYGAGHARTESAVAELAAVAARAGRALNGGPLTVEVTRTAWQLSSREEEQAADQIAPLLQALYGRGIRALSFAPGVTDAELRVLLAILDLPIERVRAAGGAAKALRARNVQGITVQEAGGPSREAVAGEPSSPLPAPAAEGIPSGAAETPDVAPGTAERVLKLLVAAVSALRLYGEPHRTVQAAIDDLFRSLHAALAAAGSLRYDVRSGTVWAGGTALEGDAMIAGTFTSDCAVRRIERLTFTRGLTRAELAQAVALLAREPEVLIVEGGFAEALRARRVTHVG
jgi:hypothetical protein